MLFINFRRWGGQPFRDLSGLFITGHCNFTMLLTSGDGVANPFEICLALSNEAMDQGVSVVEHCQVLKHPPKLSSLFYLKSKNAII